ncbi:Noranthrone monooxygenase [Penicillium chrysogenum]|uniref:Noranthrone monooxygenase n=1 Tax=Penicillium chrysogenum TaxID=5076 RepID=A0A167TYT8_PENCH|nr:Noranthrone monooxygenase [Penicillium chrysogenum]
MNSHNLAQIAAVSSSIWLSGEIFTYSWGAVPAVLEACSTSQHLAAKQWATFYHKGHSLGPPFAILGAGGFVWLALKSGCWLYWGAAILDIGIVPYTLAFMVQTNSSIFEFANVKDSSEKPASEENQLAPLLNRWACLNTIQTPLAWSPDGTLLAGLHLGDLTSVSIFHAQMDGIPRMACLPGPSGGYHAASLHAHPQSRERWRAPHGQHIPREPR